ncbi:HIT family protein [Candidatus Saccharibacteria bacterium RAAC3_TM7_1]|nr:HIT family protein [Candidatus Saccharibacteria bacterium RAAC3_TM7_1]HCZ28298.1 HIT domain-containing protein [Candidatus Saccharibacteria bacterium]
MKPSIFTKIINGEVPCHKVYEDDTTFAFLDINPATKGHTLVVPKRQVEFVWDLSDDEYQALMTTVKKIALHLREQLDVPYVGEVVVGVDVPHAHVHLIPFSKSYQLKHVFEPTGSEPNHDALAKVAELIQL